MRVIGKEEVGIDGVIKDVWAFVAITIVGTINKRIIAINDVIVRRVEAIFVDNLGGARGMSRGSGCNCEKK